MSRPLSALLAFLAATSAALSLPLRCAAASAYFNPATNGGSMLDLATATAGEPLNVIVSGLSSPGVLSLDGLENYARAIGFSTECFGIHLGDPQQANLGDGNGATDQLIELRQDYGDADVGTCLESLIGGNHFRAWQQTGALANSGAFFLAVSKEENVTDNHDIVPDGYDIGRDALVASAIGTTSFNGVTYSTVAQNVSGLLPAGATNINHDIAIDGVVTLLTVTIV